METGEEEDSMMPKLKSYRGTREDIERFQRIQRIRMGSVQQITMENKTGRFVIWYWAVDGDDELV